MLVYFIKNTINGKGYVGITTVGLDYRWKEHLSDAKHGSKLAIHRAIRKYGESAFVMSVLETFGESATRSDLDAREIYWIAEKNTFGPHSRGYNLTSGGQSGGWCVPGRFVSESTRKKISLSKRGVKLTPEHRSAISRGLFDHYQNYDGPNLNKAWSDDTALKHKIRNYWMKKPVFGYDASGLCVVMYFSVSDAIVSTGLTYRFLIGDRKKYRPKYFDGITYKKSNKTLLELRAASLERKEEKVN